MEDVENRLEDERNFERRWMGIEGEKGCEKGGNSLGICRYRKGII